MTRAEILSRYPHASESFIRANLDIENSRQVAELERDSRNEPLETHQGQKGAAGKLLVSFVSIRKRLLDPDNVSVKWTLDALRYAGVILGDEPEKITLEVSQRKARKGDAEHTFLLIKPITTTKP